MTLLVSLLLGGLAFLIVAKLLPDFRIHGGFGSAILIAAVYGVIKAILGKVLIVLTFPFVLLSLGLFIFVINAGLLWLTDRLMRRFEVRSVSSLLVGALLLSVLDWVFQLVIRRGTFYS